MIKTKCPFWHYARSKIITCKYFNTIKRDYETTEKAKSHIASFCDSMSYKDCPIYRALNKEE